MLLRSLHLEVQYEASELIKDLMRYDVQLAVLKGLVALLKPSKEDIQADKPEILSDPTMPDFGAPLSVYVQQAAACKVIRILAQQSPEVAESLVQVCEI
ncbi:armadillo-like helical domain containing 1 isoform X1 [Paramuricea clavata]|uniref:Armadillo-like helical domain containing 1 isoform X1 n=1 Tax=Paramuricea clavata TaxID=317549 RepID=A0A6S7KDW6_PARCT|nr:armadillo-like helical domain containing 1 isoform X1 [Paramuricea clavata]